MRLLIITLVWTGLAACSDEPAAQAAREQEETTSSSTSAEGFILKAGGGEALLNGIVVKASPKTGTLGSILVEQTFQMGAPRISTFTTKATSCFMSFPAGAPRRSASKVKRSSPGT